MLEQLRDACGPLSAFRQVPDSLKELGLKEALGKESLLIPEIIRLMMVSASKILHTSVNELF